MVYAIYLHRYKLWFWRCFFLNLPTWFPYFGEEPSSYTSYFRVPFWYQYCSVLHSTKKIQELSIVRVYVDLLEGYHEQCGDMFQIESGSLTIDDVFFFLEHGMPGQNPSVFFGQTRRWNLLIHLPPRIFKIHVAVACCSCLRWVLQRTTSEILWNLMPYFGGTFPDQHWKREMFESGGCFHDPMDLRCFPCNVSETHPDTLISFGFLTFNNFWHSFLLEAFFPDISEKHIQRLSAHNLDFQGWAGLPRLLRCWWDYPTLRRLDVTSPVTPEP